MENTNECSANSLTRQINALGKLLFLFLGQGKARTSRLRGSGLFIPPWRLGWMRRIFRKHSGYNHPTFSDSGNSC
jgi:hypothetical protein